MIERRESEHEAVMRWRASVALLGLNVVDDQALAAVHAFGGVWVSVGPRKATSPRVGELLKQVRKAHLAPELLD